MQAVASGDEGRIESGFVRFATLYNSFAEGVLTMPSYEIVIDTTELYGGLPALKEGFRRILADLQSLGYGETDAFPNVAGFLAASLVDLGEMATLDSTLRRFIRDREATYGEGRVPTVLAFTYARTKLRLGEIDSADVWLARALRDTTSGPTA